MACAPLSYTLASASFNAAKRRLATSTVWPAVRYTRYPPCTTNCCTRAKLMTCDRWHRKKLCGGKARSNVPRPSQTNYFWLLVQRTRV